MLKLQLERDESEETVAHYTMGSGLEAMRRDSASSFYHYNHLGTALALTGADEAVTDTYRHDAWGVLLERTGSTVNPHTYVGRERYYRMPNADLYHLGFRDYAQGVGRFMTVDPLRWRPNWRINTANRPTRLTDPLGLIGTWTPIGSSLRPGEPQPSLPIALTTLHCLCLQRRLEDMTSGRFLHTPLSDLCEELNQKLYEFLNDCTLYDIGHHKESGSYPHWIRPRPLPGLRDWDPYWKWYRACHHFPKGPYSYWPAFIEDCLEVFEQTLFYDDKLTQALRCCTMLGQIRMDDPDIQRRCDAAVFRHYNRDREWPEQPHPGEDIRGLGSPHQTYTMRGAQRGGGGAIPPPRLPRGR